MRLSQTMELGPGLAFRAWPRTGWTVVAILSSLEFAAVLWGQPSTLKHLPSLAAFVAGMGDLVPVVQTFARCASSADVGTGLMLALVVVFLPCKLAAVYLACPQTISTLDRRDEIFGWFYISLVGIVALVPAYVFGWVFGPGNHDLPSLARKTSALCRGGTAAYLVAMLQSGFALLCAYLSLVIFASGIRRMVQSINNRSLGL